LKNEPRAASVIAKTKLRVAMIDRNSFKRLLGPLDEILKRNMASYIEYA
jgi:cAMP-dependent protein kinase regulator